MFEHVREGTVVYVGVDMIPIVVPRFSWLKNLVNLFQDTNEVLVSFVVGLVKTALSSLIRLVPGRASFAGIDDVFQSEQYASRDHKAC